MLILYNDAVIHMPSLKQRPRINGNRFFRVQDIFSRFRGLRHWDLFEGIPTEEEYLAIRAYRSLLEATESLPNNEKTKVRRRVAKNLIRNVNEKEGNHKQAVEMWKVFNRNIPKGITESDYPKSSES